MTTRAPSGKIHDTDRAEDAALDQGAFDALADGIIVISTDDRILAINRVAGSLVGIERDAFIGQPLSELAEASGLDWVDLMDLVRAGRKAELIVSSVESKQILASLRRVPIAPDQPLRKLLLLRDLEVIDHERRRATAPGHQGSFQFISREKLRPNFGRQRRLSGNLDQLLTLAERATEQSANVLLTGESGVGKTEIAKHLHEYINLGASPFVHVNCGSIPDTLFESEMFGYERGAFTGALEKGKTGYIESADGGTLFLDEVGEIPLIVQAKLLKTLDSGTVQRVGGTDERNVKVRIVSATNRDIKNMVKSGQFRRDLYFRLAVISLHVRPLRESPELIDDMMDHFLTAINKRRSTPLSLSASCRKQLKTYSFPGNIRELHNIIQQLSVMTETTADVEDLHEQMFLEGHLAPAHEAEEETEGVRLKEQVRAFEEGVITRAIAKHGSKRKAAKALGVDIGTIVRKTKSKGSGGG